MASFERIVKLQWTWRKSAFRSIQHWNNSKYTWVYSSYNNKQITSMKLSYIHFRYTIIKQISTKQTVNSTHGKLS